MAETEASSRVEVVHCSVHMLSLTPKPPHFGATSCTTSHDHERSLFGPTLRSCTASGHVTCTPSNHPSLPHLFRHRERRLASRLASSQSAAKTVLAVHTLDSVRGVDVLNKRDLVAGSAALTRGDGAVGKEVLPDLDCELARCVSQHPSSGSLTLYHYDRGDDFYGWFLGPRMIYTSGIISDINKEESLEQLQDNKLAIVCEKIGLKPGEKMLDIGCGWGTLAKFASVNYGAHATGVTLGRNQTAWGNSGLRKAGISEEQSRIECKDYRDISVPEGGYQKITCLEMAEHVGVRHFSKFLRQVYDMLDDDGVFFLQIAGLRKPWQYEDLIWGLFMNKYIFPGADASTPLDFFVGSLEGAGFEIKSIDTIGVHYSATLWRWYRNWIGNKEKVVAKYGPRWYRVSDPLEGC
jgi:cyclopropane fatty-acyl-phospholipid synthase-like methyltransferase